MKTTKNPYPGPSFRPASLKFSGQIVIIAFALMLACEEEEQKQQPISIQFTSAQMSLTEGTIALIYLPFRAPAPMDGSLDIHLGGDAVYGQHYTTMPAATGNTLTLPISKGQRSVQFQILTMDNNEVNVERTILFSLQRASTGFMLGNQSEFTVTVLDSEQQNSPGLPPGPQIFASLEIPTERIEETESSGLTVKVRLLEVVEDDWYYGYTYGPAMGTGSVTVKFASGHASYGTEFNTLPAATGDSLVINFTGTQSDTTFTIIPIDNGNFSGNRFISMRIARATGELDGSFNSPYWFEIEDDEAGPNQNNLDKASKYSFHESAVGKVSR
jgi:hypothetical protein